MKIEAVHLRRFRSLEQASLENCAGLNVLIGRNNAGKSSVLAAIETAIDRLRSGKTASIWEVRNRIEDEFTNRVTDYPIQIGITSKIDELVNDQIRKEILSCSSGLEVAVEQLRNFSNASVIWAIEVGMSDAVIYVQDVGLGPIEASGTDLSLQGSKIMTVSSQVAHEFAERERNITNLLSDISAIDKLDNRMIEFSFREPSLKGRRLRDLGMRETGSPELQGKIDDLFRDSDNPEKFNAGLVQIRASTEADIDELASAETINSFAVFSGTVRKVPSYIPWFLKQLGEGTFLSFKETRPAIGRDEARQLLRLKTKRGGAEALARIQKTVRALLGVRVDAFEPENPSVSRRQNSLPEAEMDIDDFLVEANGAGIREALRIILDLELRAPYLALVEEPEVHLHPGLERVLHNYLVEKSATIQLFVATHSANFLDASTRQNIYLIVRPDRHSANVQKVAAEGDLLKVAEEVGLRPSTVLMFDRLVFVEGPSDEAILTELIRRLDINIAEANVAFVQMGGASRFAHYAAEATLDLLSRRQVKMWFLIDKDERNDGDVERMIRALGGRAELILLKRRELENYLLFPEAVRGLIIEKLRTANGVVEGPELAKVEEAIQRSAQALLNRSVELRLGKRLLKPIYANKGGSTLKERLESMAAAVNERLSELDEVENATRQELEALWPQNAIFIAPGSAILDGVLQEFGLRYKKELDGRRIAERIDPIQIDIELGQLLRKIARP